MKFKVFFKNQHGYVPFPWQQRLADLVAGGIWPEALSLPTGVGKTSIIDIWAWAIGQGIKVPTRLFYIIDRKLVVDSVADQADQLAEKTDIISAKMRGGMLLDDAWVKDPTKPAIIVSTIDQAGSRLLFRGYGVSSKVAPIHAALVANDALLVLDEAHLSPQFIHTLKTIRNKHSADFRIVEMTATPASEVEAFTLNDADYKNPLLNQRLTKPKPTTLIKATQDALTAKMVEQALIQRANGASVIGVVINRVAGARSVYESLKKHGDAVLLTGRIRDYDRQAILDQYLPRMESGSRAKGRDPLFVVATQTIEVGADLDFDALVTESTDLSGLKQRFGRVNRLGDLETAPGVIIHRDLKSKERGYKKRIAEAWKWLNKTSQKVKKDKVIDFGIRSMTGLEGPEQALPVCPTLTPIHVKALVHTSPPTPIDIHPFLHGWEDNRDISVVWRADLNEQRSDQWPDICEAVPPVVGEIIQVPVYEVHSWLNGRPYFNKVTETVTIIRPQVGDVLIVPSTYGGCDEYGWNPRNRAKVTDLADRPTEKRLRVRLSASVYPEIIDIPDWNDPNKWKDTVRAMGCDERITEKGLAKTYPAGLVVEVGLWTVQPAKTFRPIALTDHLAAVGERAESLARSTSLSDEMIEAVQMAGVQHDTGKEDPAFQLMIGGTPSRLLAKGPGGDGQYITRGWRHEMLSSKETNHTDLVRFLIGSHHGHGRGVFPASPDLDLWQTLGGLGWGATYYKLIEKHGPWRLAYLEALVRLSDWMVSEEEQV